MKRIYKFICEICREEYATLPEVKECELQGMEKPHFKIGDIVFIQAGYSWYDGDRRWVINPKVKLNGHLKHGNCFSKCCTLAFCYVITEIDQDPTEPHKLRYHLYTKAMSGEQGHQDGYTCIDTHHTPKLIKNPPKFVIKDSKKLIGKKSDYLI